MTVESVQVVQSVDAGLLEYDDDEDVDADDALAVVASFVGETGDVINIVTTSENYLYTSMSLFDPQGVEVAESDTYYGDGAIRRFELESSGSYSIRIEEANGGILDGEIEIEVQLTELISLDDGPITIEIGDGEDLNFVNFSVTDDIVYELSFMLDDEPNYSEVAIYIIENDADVMAYSDHTLRMGGGLGMSYIFEADDDGEFVMRIEYYGDDDIDMTIDVSVIEQ